jgi:hypothetical protein
VPAVGRGGAAHCLFSQEQAMSAQTLIDTENRLVIAQWEGPATHDDFQSQRDELLRLCRKTGLAKVLLDVRRQRASLSTMQWYDLGSSMPEVGRGIRFAVVCAPEERDVAFFATVAQNRGSVIRTFDRPECALAWLNNGGNGHHSGERWWDRVAEHPADDRGLRGWSSGKRK